MIPVSGRGNRDPSLAPDQWQAYPTLPGERIAVIDVIRGVAIFGILVVNMMYFAWPFYHEAAGIALSATRADRVIEIGIWFFAEGKFITMFSLLFGVGVAMLIERAVLQGADQTRLLVRRMASLLLIGLVHTVFFWAHDVLVYFALIGFMLLLFRNSPPRQLQRWVVAVLLLPIVATAGIVGMSAYRRATSGTAVGIESAAAQQQAWFAELYERALEVYRSGSFLEVTGQRVLDFVMEFAGGFLMSSLFLILGMFLTGLYIGKLRLLQDRDSHVLWWRKLLVRCAPIGVLGSLLFVYGRWAGDPLSQSWPAVFRAVGAFAGAPALSLTYVSAIVLLTRSSWGYKALAPFAAVGRTALTNYLLQSVICTTLFYGYGFGLFGRITPAPGLLLTLVIFSVQLILSNIWVRYFRYGPAELLWRRLTYS